MTKTVDLSDELLASFEEGVEILTGTRAAERLWVPPAGVGDRAAADPSPRGQAGFEDQPWLRP